MIKLTEATVALYCALQERNNCIMCNGSGISWVETDDGGGVSAELCECKIIAEHTLRHYRTQYELAVERYFAERDIRPTQAMVGHENLMMRLFGDVI